MSGLPEIEINCPSIPSQDFYIKVDGKEIKGVCGFSVKQHIDNNRIPVVTIEIIAKKVSAKLKGKIKKT